MFEGVFQAILDFALVALVFHVDEIDDHQATQVTQAQLPRDFIGGFAVGVERGLLDVCSAGGAGRVDVDGNQGFGVVDDDRATRRQRDITSVSGFDLVLDLETRKQRHIVFMQLDLVDVVRHHVGHELPRLFVNRLGIDQNFADVGLEQIADRADDQATFLINQERARLRR